MIARVEGGVKGGGDEASRGGPRDAEAAGWGGPAYLKMLFSGFSCSPSFPSSPSAPATPSSGTSL